MDRTQFLQTLTLWFVVLIYVRTDGGAADGPLVTAVGIVAVGLSLALPLALLVAVGARLRE